MRKTAAILLINLYLFNLGGYRFLFLYMHQQINKQLEIKLDKHEYNDADLVTFSIPLDIPYQNDWADFERVDGEIMINGVFYHSVKHKVKNNQLIIKCIPNPEKNKLLNQQEAFVKSINGISQNKSEGKTITNYQKVSSVNGNDYLQQNNLQLKSYSSTQSLKKSTYNNCPFKITYFPCTPEQPPEKTAA